MHYQIVSKAEQARWERRARLRHRVTDISLADVLGLAIGCIALIVAVTA